MKVKIRNVKNLKFTTSPVKLSLRVKFNGEKTYGDLTIDYIESMIKVDAGRELSKNERLDVLKEIFNRLVYKQKEWEDLIELRLVDLQKEEDENELSIIEEILTYDKNSFNRNTNMELIISYVKESLDSIQDAIDERCRWSGVTRHSQYE